MAAQPTLIDEYPLIYNTPTLPSPPRSAVFLSMTIDPPTQRRRSVHKFTSEDLAPALKSLAITPIAPPLEIQAQVRARIPTTTGGECFLYLYHNNHDSKEHLAIVFGDDIRSRSLDAPRSAETETDRIVRGAYLGRLRANAPLPPNSPSVLANAVATELRSRSEPPLVRIHSECFTGEIAHSFRCDCGEQLDTALEMMQKEGRGVLVYLRQEGRGIGLLEKLKAYNLQDLGHDTVTANLLLHHPADARNYDVAAAILKDLGLNKVKLLTNNPEKIEKASENGIEIVERVGMVPRRWENDSLEGEREVDTYLKVKVERMRHILNVPRGLEEKHI